MTSTTAGFEIPVKLHLVDGVRERLQAHISRVNAGFLVLSSPTALEDGRKLDLLYLNRPIRCEIAYCNRQPAGNYRIGARMLEGRAGSLRAERRIKFESSAKLNTSGQRGDIPVRVIDISSSGLGVKVQHPLKVGELAYVELEHGVAFGEIRHCNQLDDGYRAGLFVEEFISRTPGTHNPWAAHNPEVPARTARFSVGNALRSALLPNKKD